MMNTSTTTPLFDYKEKRIPNWYLHLVADNNQGASTLFHIKMAMEDLPE